jgi:chromosome segregation and condensation protein ScpB
MSEPPRGMRVQHDGERLVLVTSGAATCAVERLLAARQRRERIEPLTLTDSVWLVLGIVVLEQPITRAEIAARRMADSDRQVQQLLHFRLIREEPRAALPGRGIPLVTTGLLLRRLGVGALGELQQQLLATSPPAYAEISEPEP